MIPIEPKSGTNVELSLRNNWPAIQTYKVEAAGAGLEFFPPKIEITIGAMSERRVNMRVFAADGAPGLRNFQLHITGGATFDLPARALAVPRGATCRGPPILNSDGSPEWVLGISQARARIFHAEMAADGWSSPGKTSIRPGHAGTLMLRRFRSSFCCCC